MSKIQANNCCAYYFEENKKYVLLFVNNSSRDVVFSVTISEPLLKQPQERFDVEEQEVVFFVNNSSSSDDFCFFLGNQFAQVYNESWNIMNTRVIISLFNQNGDDEIRKERWLYDAVTNPLRGMAKPSMKGYTFQGYFTEQGGGGTKYFDAKLDPVIDKNFR